MSLRLVTAATAELLTLGQAKEHLRIYHDDEDDYISALIAAVTEHLTGEFSPIGRSLLQQSWEYTACDFPRCDKKLKLPKPPLISVDGVFYTPDTDIEVELTTHRVFDVGCPFGGFIMPEIDESWPDTNGEPSSVRITFTTGHSTIPTPVVHAAKLTLGSFFENREEISETKQYVVPRAVDTLLAPYRIYIGL